MPETLPISHVSSIPAPMCKGLVFGMPTKEVHDFAQRCRAICEEVLGSCAIIHCNELSSEVIEAMTLADRPFILLSDIPDRAVVQFAADSDFPVIGLNTDFAAACVANVIAHDGHLWDTIRRFTGARIGQWQLTEIPRAILLPIDGGISTNELAAKLRLPVHIADTIADAQSEEPPANSVGGLVTLPRHPQIPPEASARLEDINAFYGMDRPSRAISLRVPPEVFLNGLPPHTDPIGQISLIGPARCLVFGPYIHLPRGQWILRYHFATRNNLAGNTLMIDVLSNLNVLKSDVFELRESGAFRYALPFIVDDPWRPLEMRIVLNRGSIGGEFELLGITLERATI